MKIILCGPTLSGKDTLKNKLTKKYAIRGAVSDTTRPMRPGEVNGKDYNFIDTPRFLDLEASDNYVETATHPMGLKNCYYGYGLSKTEWLMKDICILNRHGIETVFANPSVDTTNVIVVYLELYISRITERVLKRLGLPEDFNIISDKNVASTHKEYYHRYFAELDSWTPYLNNVESGPHVYISNYGFKCTSIEVRRDISDFKYDQLKNLFYEVLCNDKV